MDENNESNSYFRNYLKKEIKVNKQLLDEKSS